MKHNNPYAAEATFIQSIRAQRFFKIFENYVNPVMLVFII